MSVLLSKKDEELLNIIYSYGGYIRVDNLKYIFDVTQRNNWYTLEKLCNYGYLNKRKFETLSRREPVTYQVTQLTCKIFNNPNSYFRKKHRKEYAYRALIKNYFCLQNYYLKDYFITDNDKKISHFNKNGFNKELYPIKINKNSTFVHFEELQIDFTTNEGNFIKQNDNILYDDNNKQTIIVYIDKYFVKPNKQVISLVNRYINLIKDVGNFKINFLIVIDDENRKSMYEKASKTIIDKTSNIDRISNETINYYAKIYSYILKKVDEKKADKFINKWQSGTLKNEYINKFLKLPKRNLSKEDKEIIEQINLKRKDFFLDLAKDISNKANNIFSSNNELMFEFLDEEVTKVFEKILLFEYQNYYFLGDRKTEKMFDIKLFTIDKTVYN